METIEEYPRTPEREDCVKRLFGDAAGEGANTSEYFSQSSEENGGASSASNQPFSSPDPEQGWCASFATPRHSPRHNSFSSTESSSMCESPPLKQPRLFTPPPHSPARKQCQRSINSPLNFELSPTPQNPTSAPFIADSTDKNGDVMVTSPPRLERLQLFDYPATPITLARGSGILAKDSIFNRVRRSGRVTRSGPELRRRVSRGTNVNPFTPRENTAMRKKLQQQVVMSPCIELMEENRPRPQKRLALRENNISRYQEEFKEVVVIGSGSFGTVYKCINRLDGCAYALKKSHKPVAGSADEAAALREVCAHAVLGSHSHLVRYYSAWAEDNHMIIQNEFCNGGNLSSIIAHNRDEGSKFTEGELKRLTRHVALALQYIHSLGLVHLDIKPDNIFVSLPEQSLSVSCLVSFQDGGEGEEERSGLENTQLLYKIGDMGHVTSVRDPQVEEGDCRYLPREILQEDYRALPKADIFALSLTVYTAGSCCELPKNGEEWHHIRNRHLPPLDHCAPSFNSLLLRMISEKPAERPTAADVLSLCSFCPSTKSKAQLCKELNEEKFKNQVLTRKLKEANSGKKLIVGGLKVNRSMSIA